MMSDLLGAAIRRLLRRVSAAPSAGLSDAELLERFVRSRDEAAIETLMWRHGPMVLTTCRRLLNHHADQEDCFQATFLVLCRRAGTIAKRESVGSWLYKVAYHICLRARAGRSRRPVPVAELGELPAPETVTAVEQEELRGLLDKELNRLPERYRAPLILHYLEEKTVEQVAQELGWRPGTVSSRLARGKGLLRVRLAGRAVTLSAGAAAAALASASAKAAAVPLPLARTTLQALLTGAESQAAATLAQGFLRAQLYKRVKWAVALLLAVGTAAGGMGAILTRGLPDAPNPAGASNADAGSVVEGPPRLDADGDPLPQGAILRLGSARFRGGAAAAAFSPDGSILTTLAYGLIRTWRADTGRPLEAHSHPDLRGVRVALSGDGTVAATQEYSVVAVIPARITVRRTPGLEAIRTLEVPGVGGVLNFGLSRDGKRLAVESNAEFFVWDVAAGNLVSRIPFPKVVQQPLFLDLSPDGKLVAALAEDHAAIRLWDVDRATERAPLTVPGGRFTWGRFSGDGKFFAANAPSKIHVWDAQTGTATASISTVPKGQAPSGSPSPFLISSDGKIVATGEADGRIHLWDAVTGLERAALGDLRESHPSGGIPLAFSADDKLLAVGGEPQIRIYDVATARRVQVTSEPDLDPAQSYGCNVAVLPDGRIAATSRCGKIELWDAQTGRKLGGTAGLGYKGCWDIAFSADGVYLIGPHVFSVPALLAGAADAAVHPAQALNPPAHNWMPLSPDGRTAAWRPNNRGSVSLQDARTGETIAALPCPAPCWTAAFSPDSRTIVVAGATYLVQWDVASGREIRRFEDVSSPPVRWGDWADGRPVAFSPDGTRLAAAGGDHDIRLWDAATGRELGSFCGHQGPVQSLAFFPDGERLLSGSGDTTALVWDLSTIEGKHDP